MARGGDVARRWWWCPGPARPRVWVRLLFLCGLGRREKGGREHGDRGRGCCCRSLLPLALRHETERERGREEWWSDGVDEGGLVLSAFGVEFYSQCVR